MSNSPLAFPGGPRQIPFSRPRRFVPVATLVILGINLAVFLLMTLAGGSKSPDVLLSFGASYAPYFHRGEYWRLVMPMFLHIGWLHLVIDGFALFVLGPPLEQVYGYGRFSLLYVGSGVGGSLVSMMRSNSVGGGASGAIFGIMGGLLALAWLRRGAVSTRWARAIRQGIVPTIVFNLVISFVIPFIDKWAHMGGLASGLLLGLLIPPPQRSGAISAGGPESIGDQPSQAIVAIPVMVVVLAMGATVRHYSESRSVDRLIEEAEILRKSHRDPQALAKFQEAARRRPLDEQVRLELGTLYLESKRAAEAVREFSEALRLDPDSEPAKLGLALAYRAQGNLARAQPLEAELARGRQSAEDWLKLASLYYEYKFYPEAIQYYQEALRLKPNLAEAHNNLAWLYATSEDTKFRDPAAALQHAQLAVQLSRSKQPAFLDTLAEAYYANGNFSEAVKVQTRTLQLDPKNSEYQDHMARYRKAAGA